jgi:hypothetical protein
MGEPRAKVSAKHCCRAPANQVLQHGWQWRAHLSTAMHSRAAEQAWGASPLHRSMPSRSVHLPGLSRSASPSKVMAW